MEGFMRSFLAAVTALYLLASCDSPPRAPASENKIDIDFGNLPDATPEEEAAARAANRRIAERFNRRAKATNIRLREAYDRGQKVCANLRAAGYENRAGCPRPTPNYVTLMHE
jgi:hypothetical protein